MGGPRKSRERVARTGPDQVAATGAGRPDRQHTGRRRWILPALGVTMAVIIVAATTYYFSGTPANPSRASAASNLVRFHSPSIGPADARVQIVEFLDPACEGCRAFHPVVKSILAEHQGRVSLTIRYAPFHKGADFAVRALEASRKQGKYPATLDTLFASQSTWAVNHAVNPRLVLVALAAVPGLDVQRLQTDSSAPEIASVIEQDLADAKALKVVQTPTFYVNGRTLEVFGFEELRDLVRSEVKASYP